MKKISLIKIIVALAVCNVYVFTCGVMGVIQSVPAAAADLPEAPEDDGNANGQGTVDFIVPDKTEGGSYTNLAFVELQQPSMWDKPVYTTVDIPDGLGEPEIQESTGTTAASTEKEIIGLEPEPEETEATTPQTAATSVTPATTPATTTPATTTTTTPATTTTHATTTTPATTTTTATPPFSGIPVEDTTVTTTTTTPEETTSDTAEETTESTTEATAGTTEPDEIENVGAATERLTVSDGGTVVTGDAIDIISRITQTEVGYTFAPEAIKAQAVAAYTYVKYYNDHDLMPQVILSDSVNDSVRTLVASVIGEAVYYDGEVIQAVYSASSAGYTASSLTVWGNEYPYLSGRYCELDAQYDPNYGRTVRFPSSDIKSRVLAATGIALSGSPADWFKIEEYLDHVYVGQMDIGGYRSYVNASGKSVKLTGKVFREKIMDFDIRSYAFDIEYDEGADEFVITTYGYGHGVGMSQNGANALATYWGYDYKQILEFYYSGCKVY